MSITKKKYPLWSIWYEDEGYDINGERIMGRQAAGIFKRNYKDSLIG